MPQAATPAFSALGGDGTLTLSGFLSSACSDTTCNASKGVCECDTYSGTLTLTGLGKVNFALNQTINDDDSVRTGGGQGLCFPFSGIGTLAGKAGSTSFVLIGGSACNNFDLEKKAIFITNGAFYIDPRAGTGKLSGGRGTGNMTITEDFNTGSAIIHVDGNFQRQ